MLVPDNDDDGGGGCGGCGGDCVIVTNDFKANVIDSVVLHRRCFALSAMSRIFWFNFATDNQFPNTLKYKNHTY